MCTYLITGAVGTHLRCTRSTVPRCIGTPRNQQVTYQSLVHTKGISVYQEPSKWHTPCNASTTWIYIDQQGGIPASWTGKTCYLCTWLGIGCIQVQKWNHHFLRLCTRCCHNFGGGVIWTQNVELCTTITTSAWFLKIQIQIHMKYGEIHRQIWKHIMRDNYDIRWVLLFWETNCRWELSLTRAILRSKE